MGGIGLQACETKNEETQEENPLQWVSEVSPSCGRAIQSIEKAKLLMWATTTTTAIQWLGPALAQPLISS